MAPLACAVTHPACLQDCPRLLSHIAKVAADKKIAGALTVNQIKQNPGQLLGALSAAEWFAVYKVRSLCQFARRWLHELCTSPTGSDKPLRAWLLKQPWAACLPSQAHISIARHLCSG